MNLRLFVGINIKARMQSSALSVPNRSKEQSTCQTGESIVRSVVIYTHAKQRCLASIRNIYLKLRIKGKPVERVFGKNQIKAKANFIFMEL